MVSAVLTTATVVYADIAAAITANTLEIIGVAIAVTATTGIYVRITSIAHSISKSLSCI